MSEIFIHDLCFVQTDRYKKELLAFGTLKDQSSVALYITDYRPFILTNIDLSLEKLQTRLQEACPYVECTIEPEHRIPLVGFTNTRRDEIFRVRVKNAASLYSVTQAIGQEAILHKMIRPETGFLHETGLRLACWWIVHGTKKDSVQNVTTTTHAWQVSYKACREQLPQPLPMQLATAYIRIHAKSLASTATNRFVPVPESDPIQRLVVRTKHGQQVLDGDDEHSILTRFMDVAKGMTVFIFCSDYLHDLLYILTRAAKLAIDASPICFVKNYKCTAFRRDGKLLDINMPGKLRVDLVHVLSKLMISPPLDGFTLRDAVAHPKLLRNRTLELTSLEMYVQALHDVVMDNSILVQHMSLSNACDLSLSHVIERGQQARIRNLFFRAYHMEGVYFNHVQLEVPFLTVQKSRANSSFPDPDWVQNPPIETLDTEPIETEEHVAKKPCLGPWQLAQERRLSKEKELTEGKRKESEKGYSGGFVVAPLAGFYTQVSHAVCTLDFASLYPSIIRGYRICFMRVVYDQAFLTDPAAELEYIPMTDSVCAVFLKTYTGLPVMSVTDRIISEVVKMREGVRTDMKKMVPGSFEHEAADARQLGCKVIQNAAYGFLGSPTSNMLCTALAAAVTNIGANMNKRVRHLVVAEFGGRCIYGDTDSCMVQFPTRGLCTDDEKLAHIYAMAHSVERLSKTMFPAPNLVEFECLKLPFWMLSKKKTYAAAQYPARTWKNIVPEQITKGMSFKKRDRCLLVHRIAKQIRDQVMERVEESTIVQVFAQNIRAFEHVPTTTEELREWTISCKLSEEYKSETVLAVHLAKQIEQHTGERPRAGTRLPYVIVKGTELHYMRARTPVLHLDLDIAWYVETQLMRPVQQLLSLPCHAPLLACLVTVSNRIIKRQLCSNTICSQNFFMVQSSLNVTKR
jgi:DNA polymerase elongation subunit (family B)